MKMMLRPGISSAMMKPIQTKGNILWLGEAIFASISSALFAILVPRRETN